MSFIRAEKVWKILEIGKSTQKNVLLWGPAGHGKSEMVSHFFRNADSTFFQSFGEGMTEDRLFGGINFKMFEDEKILEYNTSRSFLSYEYVIFEELFDAPPIVLLSLKDTIQARQLRNGAQTVPMKTKFIVGITNKSPSEISELGPTYQALIERFPLQLEVKWESYGEADYVELFEALQFHGDEFRVLAKGIGNLQGAISPRTAVHAARLLQVVGEEALQFIPGLETLSNDFENKRKILEKEKRVSAAIEEIDRKISLPFQGGSREILRQVKAIFESVEKLEKEAPYPDAIIGRCDKTIANAKKKALEGQEKALSLA